jgi:hypothetical protein
MKLFQFLLLIIFIHSCTNSHHPPSAFYYWKQEFTLSREQTNLLRCTKSEKIYIKFFDIIQEEQTQLIRPESIIQFKIIPKLKIVPCVFIQNNVFRSTTHPKTIAINSSKLIQGILNKNNIKIKELQIDCDWTSRTKSNYFSYLKELQLLNPTLLITSTIRLHQLKLTKITGIPPVKNALLMCYNMGDIENFQTSNSILSKNILSTYISKETEYPLPLDLALPVYQWGLVFRLGKLALIMNDISSNLFKNKNFRKISKNYFEVRKNGYYNQSYLCKGDLIRFEPSNATELKQCVKLLKNSKIKFNQLILYHISQQNINNYNEKFFSQINRLIP